MRQPRPFLRIIDEDEEEVLDETEETNIKETGREDPYIETPWHIIESYFHAQHLDRLVRHQLESYNNFVNYQIVKTIEMFNPVHIASEQDFDAASGKYALELFVTFENFHIYRPQIYENNGAIKLMFPQEARLRNFTYASAMTIDINIKYVVRSGEGLQNIQTFYKVLPKIHIGKLPIMLKSNICVLNQYKHVEHTHTGECRFDAGGYFIINGSEKTVLGQERAAENRVYCFNIAKNNTKYTWLAEIKSVPDYKCISPKQINMMISSKNNGFGYPIMIQIPRIKQPVPLFIVFRALGVGSDQDICTRILLNLGAAEHKDMLDFLKASIIDANKYVAQEDAIRHIMAYAIYTPINMDKETGAKKKYEFTLDILANDLFPHCQSKEQKIYFLGYMTKRLLQAQFEWTKADDRDSYLNKRVDCTGSLLNNLFRNYFNKLVKDMEKQIVREINGGSWKSTDNYEGIVNMTNIYKIVKSATIENGLKRALSTGDFGIKHTNSNKVGVAQVLNRLTYVSSLSHARRISTPTDKSGKLIPPRKLHNTSWGYVCVAETPEGQSVGVVKNLSYMTHITIHSNPLPLYDYVLPSILRVEDITDITMLFDKVKVFINGAWVGITDDPQALYLSLKEKKQKGVINIYTSVVFDYRAKEIRVCNDSGRLMRPLLRVKNGSETFLTEKILRRLKNGDISWDELFLTYDDGEAVLEYIDPEEQNLSLIAMHPRDLLVNAVEGLKNQFTHCEIHPSTMFGILASCIPFPEHNQSPRNCYQCAQGKQAMGVYVTNYENRMDKTAYVLNYPTRPLVDTRLMNMIQLNKIPSGTNVIVAIMTHTGYNQEDSLLFNKASLDRGLFLATIYHTEKDEDKQKINGDEEIRCKPDPTKTKGMKFGNYNKVNSKGVIPENTLVENRDIIIAKITPIKENRNDPTKVIKYEDQSKIFRTTEETYIDKNYIDRNGDGYNFAKVRLRTIRKPVIGDKFSSRMGQKGTIGNIIPECDMPFTKDGVKPDIIINPHAIPSRMTIGQLKETILAKALIQLGLFGDGTSFGDFSVADICKELQRVGYESHGNELLYNGLTGEQTECSVFMGPVFYQRLKHMVNDKTHSRAIGPMVNLTRQPAEGRSRDGGLRFGEMERDCESGDTNIVTDSELCVKIKNMDKCDTSVLGWCEKSKEMIPCKQTGFLYKGQRDCVKLTYEDGRTNICTPEHPILTADCEWVKAKDLVPGSTRVIASVNYPVADFEEELRECKGWELKAGDMVFKTDTMENYKKTLIFAKMIGYLITDGNIYRKKTGSYTSCIYLGHMIDVERMVKDLKQLCTTNQTKFVCNNLYYVDIPATLVKNIVQLEGMLVGKKVTQEATLPAFVLDPACPKPIVREFLGGLFGGDGHTCVLSMHRGKRDLLTSISFSQSKKSKNISMEKMFEDIKTLFARFDITDITIQALKENTSSKKKEGQTDDEKTYSLTMHLSMKELIPFSEKIGFRYCCHKSQRLEASVSYKRLRNEVTRQHNWLLNRVNELTNFQQCKRENPDMIPTLALQNPTPDLYVFRKIVPTKKAIEQATQELQEREPLVHKYAIPSCHDMTDHFVKGTEFGSFRNRGFPTAEEYLKSIGAYEWFTQDPTSNNYGVSRDNVGLPTMNIKLIDTRPAGMHDVYDIEVEKTHSFLADGVVAHNCMVSHGAARFTRGRMYDESDKYQAHICKTCGLIAAYNDVLHIHHCRTCDNRTDFAYVEIPYACKLLFQELTTMNVVPRVITN